MNAREVAKYYAGGRLVIGVLMVLFPARLMRDILGGNGRATKTGGRMIGVRDALLGAGGLLALGNGGEAEASPASDAALRPWMTYGAVSDAVDAAALLLAYRTLPPWKRGLYLLMALGGAATGAYVVQGIDT